MDDHHSLTLSRPDELVDEATAIARRRGRRAGLIPTELDDVAQTVLTRYAALRARGVRPENPGAYLETMTQNAIVDLLRGAERRHAVPVDAAGAAGDAPGDADDGFAGLLQLARGSELASRPPVLAALLGEVLGLVSPADADLVRRADLDGWSTADLAEDLGITVPAVQQRLHRARRRLRDALSARPELVEQLRQGHPQIYSG